MLFRSRDGMVLMERPAEITEEVREIERRKARDQVNNKREQLGEAKNGQFDRVKPKISTSYEPIPVPE